MIKLTSEEIRFFRDEGYVIKRKVMDETLMARARERLWQNAPPEIKRNDPDTWVGPIMVANLAGIIGASVAKIGWSTCF